LGRVWVLGESPVLASTFHQTLSKAHNLLTPFSIRACPTWVSIGVMAMLSWPSRALISIR